YVTVADNVNEQVVTGLKADTSYTFAIKAFNEAGKESELLSAKATAAKPSSGSGGGSSSSDDEENKSSNLSSSNTDLNDLAIWSNGRKLPLTPSFSPNITHYTIKTKAEKIELLANPAKDKSKLTLQGKPLGNGQEVTLKEGENKFEIIVQAENGKKKTYTITVIRESEEPKESVESKETNEQKNQAESSTQFKDSVGHWAESYINRASARGIVGGYPDGTFKPNASVTRAEFTVMLAKALKLEGTATPTGFADSKQIGAWAKDAIDRMVQAGIVSGYNDGSFRPSASITRMEMAVMFARAMKLQVDANAASPFADDKDIPTWAKGAVNAVNKVGIVNGRSENQFVPGGSATRAESAAMLIRMLEQKENQ
ncbi:MAG TPA: hypothetical protein GX497_01625, partial [Bacillus bacterium]|nr:hypothetical protein [Bacillus sp. (in: firmicutes)]